MEKNEMSHLHNHVTRSFGFFEEFLSKKRAQLANSLIPSSVRKGRVLDIGCGSFPYFLSTTSFAQRFGIDGVIDENILTDKSIKLKQGNIEKEKLPFPDNYFDVVTMLAVFEHISHERLPFVLKEIYRTLKPTGRLIITTPAPWSAPVLYLLSRISLVSKVEIDDHKHAHTAASIIEILTFSGFVDTKIRHGYFEAFLNMWFEIKK
jgi:SAM-dependent methyltransferase